MSIFDPEPPATDFQRWLAAEFAARGSFTALAVLLATEGMELKPLCATSLQITDAALAWDDIVVMFAGAGVSWDRVAFFAVNEAGGRPLDAPTARQRLRELEMELEKTSRALRNGHVFAPDGRRLADATAQVPE